VRGNPKHRVGIGAFRLTDFGGETSTSFCAKTLWKKLTCPNSFPSEEFCSFLCKVLAQKLAEVLSSKPASLNSPIIEYCQWGTAAFLNQGHKPAILRARADILWCSYAQKFAAKKTEKISDQKGNRVKEDFL
jgi:hypothetical protein